MRPKIISLRPRDLCLQIEGVDPLESWLLHVLMSESPNNELVRRYDHRAGEDWKAMIADVCNRLGT